MLQGDTCKGTCQLFMSLVRLRRVVQCISMSVLPCVASMSELQCVASMSVLRCVASMSVLRCVASMSVLRCVAVPTNQ